MKLLPQTLFDVYALSLPRGHGFGDCPPIGAWQSDDGQTIGTVTSNEHDGSFGIIVMRRREDHVWSVVHQEHGFASVLEARKAMEPSIKEDAPPEPVPANTARRPSLSDLQNREPNSLYKLLSQPTHHVAAWLLNQLYLAFPNPDRNWASDFQTDNFHTRMWEAHLLACLREQGMLVTQPHCSPDFRIENRTGKVAWIEAVTANPTKRYDHVNAGLTDPPEEPRKRNFGPAAERFAKTLRNKLMKRYDLLDHVSGNPFVIALADFHAPGSMVWSREALVSYLYGVHAEVVDVDGKHVVSGSDVQHLLGETKIPAGLFRIGEHAGLSAVIFTNACTISKFNRVGVSSGALTKGLRYVRMGKFYDRTPNALEGIPFCMDITSEEYRAIWPQGYEPWSAELEVFHNPNANCPLTHDLLPEATHWFDNGDGLICESYYETFVLRSRTLIQNEGDPFPAFGDYRDLSE